ncbi:hypothetical protein K7432_017543 [Basidiobolus ranarum]|uniref:Carrier domain-containing protein n=1 Tax=Basidiobolus ranarum TaxID=34480 RepID=A0ABR2VK84_9FUNG
MMSEKELLVDPAFFFALKEEIPEIAHVEILTKTGRSLNELTQYRYQVIIRVGASEDSQVIEDWVDYQTSDITLDYIKQTLKSGQKEYFALENVINRRLIKEVTLVKLLESHQSQNWSVAKIKALQNEMVLAGVEVEDLLVLSEETDYNVDISWNRQKNDGCLDVIFFKRELPASAKYRFKEPNYSVWKWRSYGNNPMHETVNKMFVPHLREHLRTVLPKFMIPSAIIILESLPLMQNGKINRGALPAPTSLHTGVTVDYVEPRNILEETLGGIFAEVLGFKRVGIHDNFFDMGGHSLSATRVMSRIRVVLGQEVPLKMLFEAPSIASLSERLESTINKINVADNTIPVLNKLANRNHLPLSFAQERLWFMNELLPNSSIYNIPFALTLLGELNVDALKKSILDIIVRHEALRTTFVMLNNEPVQTFRAASSFSTSLIQDVDGADDPELVKAIFAEESRKPFDLAIGPLIRVKIIRISREKHVLIVVTHHIVSDGWSVAVLQKELSALYESNSLGKPSPLSDPVIQYADFAVWQRQWLQGDNLDIQMRYWKEQLSDFNTLELPTDFVRPAVLSYQANIQEMNFSSALTNQLKELSKLETSTLKTLPSALLLLIVIVKR